jgi:hypothetical protein
MGKVMISQLKKINLHFFRYFSISMKTVDMGQKGYYVADKGQRTFRSIQFKSDIEIMFG